MRQVAARAQAGRALEFDFRQARGGGVGAQLGLLDGDVQLHQHIAGFDRLAVFKMDRLHHAAHFCVQAQAVSARSNRSPAAPAPGLLAAMNVATLSGRGALLAGRLHGIELSLLGADDEDQHDAQAEHQGRPKNEFFKHDRSVSASG